MDKRTKFPFMPGDIIRLATFKENGYEKAEYYVRGFDSNFLGKRECIQSILSRMHSPDKDEIVVFVANIKVAAAIDDHILVDMTILLNEDQVIYVGTPASANRHFRLVKPFK